MFLELDGEGGVFGNFLDDLDFGNANFVAAGGALLGADFAGDDDTGFLGEAFESCEGFGIFLQRANTLDNARAIAKDGEDELARFANVVEPAADRDFLSVVFASVFNRDHGHRDFLWRRTNPIV